MIDYIKCLLICAAIIVGAFISKPVEYRANWFENRIINHLTNISREASETHRDVFKLRFELEKAGIYTNNPPLTGWIAVGGPTPHPVADGEDTYW